jgi:hypothetical protein
VHRPISLTVAIAIYPASKHRLGAIDAEFICVYCAEKFPLNESQVLTGLIFYDEKMNRWSVPHTTEIHIRPG